LSSSQACGRRPGVTGALDEDGSAARVEAEAVKERLFDNDTVDNVLVRHRYYFESQSDPVRELCCRSPHFTERGILETGRRVTVYQRPSLVDGVACDAVRDSAP
jgi:hypothetical protein